MLPKREYKAAPMKTVSRRQSPVSGAQRLLSGLRGSRSFADSHSRDSKTLRQATRANRNDATQSGFIAATVDILATYLKTPTAPATPLGIGDPQLPPDFSYAAADLNKWLQEKETFLRLTKGARSELPNVDLTQAWLYGVSWRNIDLSWLGARYLPEVDLRRASLSGSKWGPSTFRGAHLGCANLSGASLEGSDFTAADLHGATIQNRTLLKEAHLRKTTFAGANLAGADLTLADLGGADLTNANLRGADLTSANLLGANLTGADLTGATTDGAKNDNGTLDSARDQPRPAPDSAPQIDDPACPAPSS